MKKSNTRVLALAAWLAAGMAGTVGGIALPVPAQAAADATAPLELAKDAPDSYTVVKGDTLWDISGRFLEKPWRWPEIWQLNREQIANPHWIYPGDIVYLDRTGPNPRLRLGRSIGDGSGQAGGSGSVAMRPMVRSQSLNSSAIPTISASAIEAFLNRPLIVDEESIGKNPYIVGAEEGRLFLSRGDLAYVRGLKDAERGSEWQIYRPSRPLLDPDTRKPIAHEALYVGSVRLERNGDPATVMITGTSEEIGNGDRLLPLEKAKVVNYSPHSPETQMDGRIVSVYRGVSQAGRNSVVAINLGKSQGVEVGHVLAIEKRGAMVTDKYGPKIQQVKLPDQSIGYLLIFRVFDKIAYGLIMDASKSVAVGDNVTTP